jgi:phage terminase large subunit-like protein
MLFFAAGKEHRERLMLAANRVGKSLGVGGYETVLHLTGEYPDWWPGRRFPHPINAWAAGDTSNTVRDILQKEILLGSHGDFGTGLIPKNKIDRVTWKRNVPEAVQDIFVKHASGKNSQLTLKSYDQGRESFQGTAQHLVWLDEEMPLNIYTECLLRTMTTNGMILLTFTPLKGKTEVINMFLPEGHEAIGEDGVVVVSSNSIGEQTAK